MEEAGSLLGKYMELTVALWTQWDASSKTRELWKPSPLTVLRFFIIFVEIGMKDMGDVDFGFGCLLYFVYLWYLQSYEA